MRDRSRKLTHRRHTVCVREIPLQLAPSVGAVRKNNQRDAWGFGLLNDGMFWSRESLLARAGVIGCANAQRTAIVTIRSRQGRIESMAQELFIKYG